MSHSLKNKIGLMKRTKNDKPKIKELSEQMKEYYTQLNVKIRDKWRDLISDSKAPCYTVEFIFTIF